MVPLYLDIEKFSFSFYFLPELLDGFISIIFLGFELLYQVRIRCWAVVWSFWYVIWWVLKLNINFEPNNMIQFHIDGFMYIDLDKESTLFIEFVFRFYMILIWNLLKIQ